jgi:hypothetical protein
MTVAVSAKPSAKNAATLKSGTLADKLDRSAIQLLNLRDHVSFLALVKAIFRARRSKQSEIDF